MLPRLLHPRNLFALPLLSLLIISLAAGCGRDGSASAATPESPPAAPTNGTPEAALAPEARGTATPPRPTAAPASTLTNTAGWSQLGGNPQRTHYVDATLPARQGTLAQDWRVLWIWNGPAGVDTGAAANHLLLPDSMAPVTGDGRLYVGHSDGGVRAISAATGGQAWLTDVDGSENNAIFNSGAYDSATGAVYFASLNGRLYKLRATDGQVLGSFNAGAPIEQAVLLVGDTVFIGTRAGNLYAVDTATMQQRWAYSAGAPITASSAYASKGGGLVIFPSEDAQVHAVRATTGARAWRVAVNAFERPDRDPRPPRFFPDVYAVVAETADVVIIRSYFDWNKTWTDPAGAPSNQADTRRFIQNNPGHESLFVLDLDDGAKRFVAPVLGGAIGNGNYYYSAPPQAVVRRLPDGSEVAYLLWRNRQACRLTATSCDGREDTTIGEMDLTSGAIRFVRDFKNEGTIRLPTDEHGALSMVGNVLFHSHWMSLGAIRITNPTTGGTSYADPIPSEEYLSVSNTIAVGQCAQRDSARRFCPVGHTAVGDGYQLDPGFYIYYASQNQYDRFFGASVRGPIFDGGVLYWRSNDGAIIALAPAGTVQPPPPSTTPPPTTPSPLPLRGYLPVVRR